MVSFDARTTKRNRCVGTRRKQHEKQNRFCQDGSWGTAVAGDEEPARGGVHPAVGAGRACGRHGKYAAGNLSVWGGTVCSGAGQAAGADRAGQCDRQSDSGKPDQSGGGKSLYRQICGGGAHRDGGAAGVAGQRRAAAVQQNSPGSDACLRWDAAALCGGSAGGSVSGV